MNAERVGRPKSRARRRAGSPLAEPTEDKAPALLSAVLPAGGPGDWNDGAPLRATVLLHAPEDLQRYFRILVDTLFRPLLAHGSLAGVEDGGAHVETRLRAAMLDLRYTATFLGNLAREAAEVEMERGPAEKQPGDFAAEIALDIEKIVKTIEARIG